MTVINRPSLGNVSYLVYEVSFTDYYFTKVQCIFGKGVFNRLEKIFIRNIEKTIT